jgi:CHAT domain-containing protein
MFVALFLFMTVPPVAPPAFTAGSESAAPDVLVQQGGQAFAHGAFDQALAAWKEAARLYERDERVKEHSRALVHVAQAEQSLGQLRPALQHLELALSLAQQAGDPVWMAVVLDGMGRAYFANRQPEAAVHHLTQALEIARQQETRGLAAAVLNDLGILRSAYQQYLDALAAFTESDLLAQGTNQPALAIRARLNAARVALRLKRHQDARLWLDQAYDQLKDLPVSHDKATALIALGLLYHELRGAFPDLSDPLVLRAAAVLQDAAGVAEQMGDARTLSYAWGHLGHLYETEHRYDDALTLTRQAVFAAQSAGAPESLYRWQWQTGRLLAAQGQLDEAISAYRSATATLQPIRPEVATASQDAGSPGQGSVRPLFFEFADLLLQRAALTEEGPASQGYLKAARDAVEASKAAELRDYFRDECVDALQAHTTTLDAISKTTAVLYPIIFADRTELLVSLPTGLKRVTVPVPSMTLTQEVRTFRRLLEKRTTREYLPHAQQLYEWLLRPLDADLKAFAIDTLVVVPDGPLRTIPLAALHDGAEFAIQRYAIATTPGLNLTDPRPINRERLKMLAGGLTQAAQGFPPLPHVTIELQAIRTLYGGDQLVNKQFLVSGLEKELKEKPLSVLHIASHGRFEKDVAHSFVLTYDDKLTMAKLDQYVGLFRFRQDPLELLTLSACETAAGDDRAALGLAGVAIKAGARSALATLWSINDEASSTLVAEFYKQLRDPTASKAVALQRAQLKLLGDPVYQHPAYWSPFLLLNNWL